MLLQSVVFSLNFRKRVACAQVLSGGCGGGKERKEIASSSSYHSETCPQASTRGARAAPGMAFIISTPYCGLVDTKGLFLVACVTIKVNSK